MNEYTIKLILTELHLVTVTAATEEEAEEIARETPLDDTTWNMTLSVVVLD